MEDQLNILSKTYRTSKTPLSYRKGWDDLYPRLPSRRLLIFQSILVKSVIAFLAASFGFGGTLSVAQARPGNILYPIKVFSNKVVEEALERANIKLPLSIEKRGEEQERPLKPSEILKPTPTRSIQNNQQKKSDLVPTVNEEVDPSNRKNNAENNNSKNTNGEVKGSKENKSHQSEPGNNKNNLNNDNSARGNRNSKDFDKKPK